MEKYNIAVIGATGIVGREMMSILADRAFPIKKIYAIASRNSIGKDVSFGDVDIVKVKSLDDFDFAKIDIALFAAGSEVAKVYAPQAAKAGCIVIDNSSHFRMDEDVPLIIPEVNKEDLFGHKNIIANPNCSTIQMVVALSKLHEEFGIKRIVVSTYQAVSGAGKASMDELYSQTKGVYVYNVPESVNFSKRIAFNVIPHIDRFMDDGSTKEEWKMVNETKKIIGADIAVSATCVRVPVFIGHAESVNVEFEDDASIEQVIQILSRTPSVVVVDKRENGGYITPAECAGEDAVYVSRIRKDPSLKSAINLWIVSDNVRKGAALNAVQIAEELIKNPFKLMNVAAKGKEIN